MDPAKKSFKDLEDIIKDNDYMCRAVQQKNTIILNKMKNLSRDNVEEVLTKIKTLLHNMSLNLADFQQRFEAAEQQLKRPNICDNHNTFNENENKTKKKLNLSLNRTIGDEESDSSDVILKSGSSVMSVVEVQSSKSDDSHLKSNNEDNESSNDESDSENVVLESHDYDDNLKLRKEANISGDEYTIVSSSQGPCDVNHIDNCEDEKGTSRENQEFLDLLNTRVSDLSQMSHHVVTPNEADAVLERLNSSDNESNSSDSDSDFSLSISSEESDKSSACSVIHRSKKKPKIISESSDSEAGEQHKRDLVVKLQRVDDLSDAELNRLCNLENLDKKSCKRVLKQLQGSRVKKSRTESCSSSDATIYYCDRSGSATPELDVSMEEDLRSYFTTTKDEAMAILKDLNRSNSDVEYDEESDDKHEKSRKDNQSDQNVSTSNTKQTAQNTKLWSDSESENDEADVVEVKLEEDDRNSNKNNKWKRDSLLTTPLSSDSESDEDCWGAKKRKGALSDDDDNDGSKRSKSSRSKSDDVVIIDESSSSSTENFTDIEFLTHYGEIDDDSDVECLDDVEGTKGRKNLKPIMADENLTEETQKAKADEEERIKRLEEHQKNLLFVQSQHEEFVLDVDITSGRPLIVVDQKLADKLKPHQRDGVKFMWEACYESVDMLKKGNKGSGCVLAHCMGLGKTLQVITLVHTLFEHDVTNTRHVLIVSPLSTVSNWRNEFQSAFNLAQKKPNIKLFFIVGGKIMDKYRRISEWYKNGGVLVLGYEAYTILTSDKISEKVSAKVKEEFYKALVDPGPDLIVCDEGHLIKNDKTLRNQALMRVKTKRRIVLTGTPLQNNLMEYYHMVKFIKPNLLGTSYEYKNRFRDPIMNGQFYDSTEHDKTVMKKRTHCLNKLLKKTVHRVESKILETYLPPIVDYTISIKLSEAQIEIYKRLIDLVKSSTETRRRCFFFHFQLSKYISLHPYVLHYYYNEYHNKQHKKKKHKEISGAEDNAQSIDDEIVKEPNLPTNWYLDLYPADAAENKQYGPKLKTVIEIINEAVKYGDKTLLFSSSLVEFDVIEHFLKMYGTPSCRTWVKGVDYYRMDGNTKAEQRQEMCERFNDSANTKIKVFMVSHMVGGLGLNLTAANRVVLVSTNFNPCHDTQSIYRAYRFGQTKTCYVYRLIAEGTMEARIYETCVIKLAVAGTVVDKFHFARHYSSRSGDIYYKYDFSSYNTEQRELLANPSDKLLAKLLATEHHIFKFHEHRALLTHRPEEELDDVQKKVAEDEFDKEISEARNSHMHGLAATPAALNALPPIAQQQTVIHPVAVRPSNPFTPKYSVQHLYQRRLPSTMLQSLQQQQQRQVLPGPSSTLNICSAMPSTSSSSIVFNNNNNGNNPPSRGIHSNLPMTVAQRPNVPIRTNPQPPQPIINIPLPIPIGYNKQNTFNENVLRKVSKLINESGGVLRDPSVLSSGANNNYNSNNNIAPIPTINIKYAGVNNDIKINALKARLSNNNQSLVSKKQQDHNSVPQFNNSARRSSKDLNLSGNANLQNRSFGSDPLHRLPGNSDQSNF